MAVEKSRLEQAYEEYLNDRCDYWHPGEDGHLAGEIVFKWAQREQTRRTMQAYQ